MPITFSHFSRALAALLTALACTLALALPTPKDINAAVEAGDFKRAETLLLEVLAEKPNSAKAHYELGEVLAREKRYDEALAQLQKARTIDPALKFASSPDKFQQVLDKVGAAAASAKVATQAVASPAAASAAPAPERRDSGFPTGYIVGGILLIVLVVVLIRRSNAATRAPQGMYPALRPMAQAAPCAPACLWWLRCAGPRLGHWWRRHRRRGRTGRRLRPEQSPGRRPRQRRRSPTQRQRQWLHSHGQPRARPGQL